MASPKLYPIGRYVLNQHHAFGFLASTFQNQIVAFRFLNRQQLFLPKTRLHNHREVMLTDFTFEFIKIEMYCPSHCLLLHLEVNPFR